MPSSNNLIQSLRSAHDPHFKLEGRVGGLEKGMGVEVAKLHKTLSKSFVLQRKTLARVLGLEGKVSELEAQQAAEDQAKEGIDEILNELGVGGEQEAEAEEEEMGGGTKTKTKPKAKKKPKIKVKKKKIKAKDIGFNSRVFGKDESGEYLSSKDRKNRFKLSKKGVSQAPYEGVSQAPYEGEQSTTQTSSVSDGLLNAVKGIAESVDRIKESLIGQGEIQKDIAENKRKSGEEKEAKKRESGLEKFLGPVKKVGDKILKPFKSMLSQVFDFLTTIFFGRVAFKLFEWFSNPANTDRITSIFKFISDWWPVLLAGIMAFLPGLLGPLGLIAGTIALLAWGIPKIINAVKSIFGFGKDIDKELKSGSDKLNSDVENAGKDAEKKLEPGKEDKDIPGQDPSKAGVPSELSGVQQSQEDVQKLAKGGEVQGSGDKDTVPAMLTPGEFVMSKGAVEEYGVNTLEGMNAAAGGTNIPTMQKGGGKGMNLGVPRFGGGGMTKQQQIMRQTDYGEDGSISTFQATPEQRKASYAEMGIPSMELMDGSVVPDIGKMGAEKIPAALAQTRQNMVETGASPENIAKLDELIASPDVQPAALQNSLNRIVPGSQAQVYGDLGDSITASARMNGGGLVLGFQGGGIVPKGKGMKYDIKPNPPKNTVVAYEQEVNKNQQQKTAPASGGNEIPSFDVSPIRDPLKMVTLQIVLF